MSTTTAQRSRAGAAPGILILERDRERRLQMTTACERAGLTVVAFSRVAEIERWPIGDIVVTDAERFSEMWKRFGAAHVLVLSSTASEGIGACARGASAWIPRLCSAEALAAVILTLAQGESV